MAKAYILMNCALGSETDVISSLRKIKGMKEVHGIMGLYDIIAQIELDTEDNIRDFVTKTLRKMPKITSTMTLTRSESEDLFSASEKLVGLMLGQNAAQAYVVIHCDRGEEYPLLKNLSHIPEIKEADVVFGFYDVICKIEASDDKALERIVTKALRSIPHIKSSMTLTVIPEQG